MERSDAVGRKWFLGIGAAIVIFGIAIVAMMVMQPSHAWAWALMLLLYIPAILVTAAVLKFLVLLRRRVM